MLKVSAIYAIADKLPLSEDFNLKSQLRRAAVSVVSNIAEESARASGAERKGFMRFQGAHVQRLMLKLKFV
jgi:four helix bundle protein